jgi:hypothetical protein
MPLWHMVESMKESDDTEPEQRNSSDEEDHRMRARLYKIANIMVGVSFGFALMMMIFMVG